MKTLEYRGIKINYDRELRVYTFQIITCHDMKTIWTNTRKETFEFIDQVLARYEQTLY